MSDNADHIMERDPVRLCYVCRMPISVLAIKCRYCGADVGRPRKEQETFTVEDLGGEKVGTYTISGNVTDALESFILEERAQLKAEEQERIEMDRRSLGGRLRSMFGMDAHLKQKEQELESQPGPLDIKAINLSTGTHKPKTTTGQEENKKRILTVVMIIACLVLLYLTLGFIGGFFGGGGSEAGMGEEGVYLNRARAIVEGGGSMFVAHEEALLALKKHNTPANRAIAEETREMVIKNIRARAFSNPFDREKLSSASRDITRMAAQDTDPEIIKLMEEINREIGYFAFILKDWNLETGTAIFTLNNPSLKEKEQTVKVEDLLQERFRVVAMNVSGVILEDTHPEAGGRQLIAKKLISVAPY